MRKYEEAQLRAAIPASRSWRGVLQELGLKGTSAGSQRAVRRHADRLGLDYSHFTGQRRWTDSDLRAAVRASESWSEVTAALGLSTVSGTNTTTLRNHCLRLGLETEHLGAQRVPDPPPTGLEQSTRRLSRAGSFIAAAWFELCGCPVSWPLEPSRYDLLVWRGDRCERIQVKTTTRRSGSTWTVSLSTRRKLVHTYSAEEIDQFFIVAADYSCYLIPLKVVAGLGSINLAAYQAYQVRAFTAPAAACPPPRTPRPGSSSGH